MIMLLTKSDTLLNFEFGLPDPNYRREETVSTGFTDITSVENINKYGRQLCTDYLQWRQWLWDVWLELGNTTSPADPWETASALEIDIIIDLHIFDRNLSDVENNQKKVIHLMTYHGLSETEAKLKLIKSFAKHHPKLIKSCQARAKAEKLYQVIATYLTLEDAKDFFQTVRDLFIDYREQGIMGSADGNVGIGFFDYIESTPGTIYETAGLESKGYTMQTGDTNMTNFINSLMEIFRKGNY